MPRMEEESWAERQRLAGEPKRTPEQLARLVRVEDEGQPFVIERVGQLRRADTFALLAEFLGHHDARVRAAAALAVMRADPPRARSLVRPLLTDPERRVVEAAAGAFTVLAEPEDLAALAPLVDHDDRDVRQPAASALAWTGSEAALPHLERLLGDRSGFVRGDARTALISSGIPGSPEVLAANRRRWGRRALDARAARRAIALREQDPAVIVSTRTTYVAAMVDLSITAPIIVAVPLLLGHAGPWVSLVGMLLGLLVAGLFASVAMSSSAPLASVAHDRARCRQIPPPDGARRRGLPSAVLVGFRPRGLVGTALVVGAPLLAEALLPTGGIVSGFVAGAVLAAVVVTRRRVGQLGAAARHTFSIPRRGAARDSRVYLDP